MAFNELEKKEENEVLSIIQNSEINCILLISVQIIKEKRKQKLSIRNW